MTSPPSRTLRSDLIDSLDVLRIAQGLILVFGGIIVFIALRGYSKRGSSSMLYLAIGFGFVTVGAVLAGLLFEVMNSDLVEVAMVQATFQAFGSFMIVLSLVLTKH